MYLHNYYSFISVCRKENAQIVDQISAVAYLLKDTRIILNPCVYVVDAHMTRLLQDIAVLLVKINACVLI